MHKYLEFFVSNVIKLHHFVDRNKIFRVQIILFQKHIYSNSFKIELGNVFEIKEINYCIHYNNAYIPNKMIIIL